MSDYEFRPPSPIRASQLDPEDAELLMKRSELMTETEFDNESDLAMLREGNYDLYMEKKLGKLIPIPHTLIPTLLTPTSPTLTQNLGSSNIKNPQLEE